MGVEIERKFIVELDLAELPTSSEILIQGYLAVSDECEIRVRTISEASFITIKNHSSGAKRLEYEYSIPAYDAQQLIFLLCENRLIEKTRYKMSVGSSLWEIDVLSGRHTGLIFAEIELLDEREIFERPSWLGREITSDLRFRNSSLAMSSNEEIDDLKREVTC